VTNVGLPERGDPFGAVVDDFEEVIVECANLVTQFLDHGTDRFERHNFSLVGDRNLAMWCPRTPKRLASAPCDSTQLRLNRLKTTENEVRGKGRAEITAIEVASAHEEQLSLLAESELPFDRRR
jgi:hypothetical protein